MRIGMFALVIAALSLALPAGSAKPPAKDILRVTPATVHFGTKRVGTFNLKGATITNTSSSTINLIVTGSRLPDDFSFGILPGSTCPVFGPTPLEPGESCTAVVGFRPSDFFAGENQLAQLEATATDPASGEVIDAVLIDFIGRGQL